MSALTCITCRVLFESPDIQRSHYKTDWHRYNLKRKVADLPSVSAEEFRQRVTAQQAQVRGPGNTPQTSVEAQTVTTSTTKCTVCSKNFSSQSTYDNHINSKKHKEMCARQEAKKQMEDTKVLDKNAKNQALKDAMKAGDESDEAMEEASASAAPFEDEDMDSDEEEWEGDALGLEECLFCPHLAKSFPDKLSHMVDAHSFFLPDADYVSDLEGLMTYLGQKVGEGHVCLWCNERGRSYQSTPAVQQHMRDKGHTKMLFEGDVLVEYSDFYDYRPSYPDYTPGDADKGDEEEELAPPPDLSDDNFQLVLPSGSVVGHRTLMRYYRQKLRADRPVSTRTSHVLAQYRGLGWTGKSGENAKKVAKDIQYMKRVAWKKYTQLGVKANKMQHHFRPQVVF